MINYRETGLGDEFLALALEADELQEEVKRLNARLQLRDKKTKITTGIKAEIMSKMAVLGLSGEAVAVEVEGRDYDLEIAYKIPTAPQPTLRGEESVRRLLEAGVGADVIEAAKVQGEAASPSVTIKRKKRKEK